MTTFAAPRISRRGYHTYGSTAHLSVDSPCLNPDLPFDDTDR